LANQIDQDRIDILIDLSGHTARNRLCTFARKPAPIQASWMGYPGTTGLAAMDYYFADAHFLPCDEFGDRFTEKLVHLPAAAPFLPEAAAPPVSALPALSNGYLTFGSFNRPSKLGPSVIALWSQLLRALPEARMILGAMPQDGQYGQLIEWFAAEGIARDRLEFQMRCDTASYLARHHRVDLCLDAFPYTGGTTTAHALWMGVPTLTLAGRTPASRHGATILKHVGLDEFVARTPAEYVRKGVELASHLGELAQLRTGLRARCSAAAFSKPDEIAVALERALRIMWKRWCAGLPAEAFSVTMGDATV
jgi:predicted O-linked N-acetylglucosamine transferase (SPINDLY family)